jgi:membrane-associated protease RseP (regulator of RpoE activity)
MAPYGNLGAISMVGVALLIAAALGGFVLFMIIALAYGAGLAVYGVLLFAITSLTTVPNTTGLSNSIPGVAPLIPGITLPLAQGLLAFILILVVHEFSHGVLARISKVKVKSSGFIGIGVVPIGAFVEPDEKQISKLSRKLQNRISVAGMSANLLFCLITFVPTILMFYYVMPHTLQTYTYIEYVVPNSPAYNAHLMAGSTLLSWNGHPTSNVTDMEAAAKGDAPDSMVSVATNVSTYSIIANQTGKIGVIVGEGQRLGGANPGPVVSFIYSFFALSFLLNFLIALVNFLPVPSFDGWRIFNTSIKNYKMVKYLSTFVILLVLLNALPWIWNL